MDDFLDYFFFWVKFLDYLCLPKILVSDFKISLVALRGNGEVYISVVAYLAKMSGLMPSLPYTDLGSSPRDFVSLLDFAD